MVRGLTTYISQKIEIFMADYEFPHNSIILIDGDVIAVTIYSEMEKRNSCFGGDYDKYANVLRAFFNNFSKCKVIPYIVFDGVGSKKRENSNALLKERIQKSTQLEYLNNDENNQPAFVVEVFKCIVQELSIKMVMSNFDSDCDIASIAKTLNCPVLSNDSDFYIYDIKYIPYFLNKNEINIYVYRKFEKNNEVNKYLKCMMFNREKFLNYTGLTLEKLPILAIYLGNNYTETFIAINQIMPQFCSYLNLKKGNSFIVNIIKWLSTKKTEVAVQIMLNFFRKDETKKKQIKELIDEVINEYTCKKTSLLKYLHDSDNIQTESSDEHELDADGLLDLFSNIFVDRFRRGFYHKHFLDILLFNKYYPKPLVEDVNRDVSHKLCFPIISAIHKILTNISTVNLLVYIREGADISANIVPKYQEKLPYYEELQEMNDGNKLHYFFNILQIEENFRQDLLELFPESWHILLLTLKYLSKVTKVEDALVSSLIIAKIILSHVDKKLGYIRTKQDYDRLVSKYEGKTDNENTNLSECLDVAQAFEQISVIDSLKALEICLPFFELSTRDGNYYTLYKINLIHSMSEFQSCLLHVGFLNDLFGAPFKKCLMWECYNGTFIYNMLCQPNNHNIFVCTPTIFKCFQFILALVQGHIV